MHEEAFKGLVIHLLRILFTNSYQRNNLYSLNDLAYKSVFFKIHLRWSEILKIYVVLYTTGWILCKFGIRLQEVYIHQCRNAKLSDYNMYLLLQLDNASSI